MTKLEANGLLSAPELAKLIGVSRAAAYRLKRQIPHLRLPGVGLRFARSDVEAWLASHRCEPAAVLVPARRAGMRVASATTDDDEEVLPGLTRRQLREQARSV